MELLDLREIALRFVVTEKDQQYLYFPRKKTQPASPYSES